MSASLGPRLWRYQAERFPLLRSGLVIAAFGGSTVAFSHLARGAAGAPSIALFAGAIASSLAMMALMRIADEHKDAAEDAAFRPYRPVPRGLVSLGELRLVGACCAGAQLAIALAISPHLIPGLLLLWVWYALMTAEFFVPAYLRAHPALYLASHMAIMPLLDFYVSSFDWAPAGAHPPATLAWFLGLSFANGLVVEIGRKLRQPRDEERGVETYSALWGRANAGGVWIALLAVAAAVGCAAAHAAALPLRCVAALAGVFVIAFAFALGFLFRRVRGNAIEAAAGAWTFVSYTALGLLPLGVTLR
jgi:4-hydroxybenzoate polyprenyltransferase